MMNEVLIALIAFFSIGGIAIMVSNHFTKEVEDEEKNKE